MQLRPAHGSCELEKSRLGLSRFRRSQFPHDRPKTGSSTPTHSRDENATHHVPVGFANQNHDRSRANNGPFRPLRRHGNQSPRFCYPFETEAPAEAPNLLANRRIRSLPNLRLRKEIPRRFHRMIWTIIWVALAFFAGFVAGAIVGAYFAIWAE
jgi:hypothetical protein